jgi:hypothetical protein
MGQIVQTGQMQRISRRIPAIAMAVFLQWDEKTANGIGR